MTRFTQTIATLTLMVTLVGTTMAAGALAAAGPAPDAFERAVNRQVDGAASQTADAHGRTAETSSAATQVAAPPDWFERTANRLVAERASAPLDSHQRTRYVSSVVSPAPAPTVAPGDGFAWGDALLGATAALVVVLGAAAALSIRHRRSVVLP
jgi:hypothetical protein